MWELYAMWVWVPLFLLASYEAAGWSAQWGRIAGFGVLAAGGIGSGRQIAAALAMGAQGVWTGSIWLTVSESSSPLAQKEAFLAATSRDTVRSRSVTGKPARMLRNEWTEAWESEETPEPLGMPLQGMVTMDAVQRTHRYAESAQKVAFNPVGQVVGMIERVESVRQVMQRLSEEYLNAIDRLESLQPQ